MSCVREGAACVIAAAMLGCAGAAEDGPGAAVPAQGKEAAVQERASGSWSPGLTEEETATLFRLVRETLSWCVGGVGGAFSFDGYDLTETLRKEYGTFVTLKKAGHLRGCIGSLEAREALYLSAHHNAINAALKDPRFPPVRGSELGTLEVHVSVLSAMMPIASLAEFHLGEHGIVMEKGWARAVYLPEVAIEQGWTKEETLRSLSMKAGLDGDAWREGARFEVFSSVVLSQGE